MRSIVSRDFDSAASAAAAGSTIWRSTKRSLMKAPVGEDCMCQASTSGSNRFQSSRARTRVPVFGRAAMSALALSRL